MFYIVAKFQPPTYYTFRDMIYFSSLIFGLVQTDRKRCIRAHRALAQVGSIKWVSIRPDNINKQL